MPSQPTFDVPGLRAGETTLPAELRKLGYRTSAFGKWHLGSVGHSRPRAQGFEIVIEDDGSGMAATTRVSHERASWSQSHFGIEIMQERAQRLGGSVELSERDGGGMRVRLMFPADTDKADS